MRGKASKQLKPFLKDRITPVYAGKSPCKRSLLQSLQDHPRLCGEKLSDFSIIAKVLGSPPPMRGKE